MDFQNLIDWTSVKLCGVSVILAAITWSQFLGAASFVAVFSTILYNGIRIFKEIKKKK